MINTTYGGVIGASRDFLLAPGGGGIMGLSLGHNSNCDGDYTCLPPVLDDVVAQKGLKDMYGLCAYDGHGALVLGGNNNRLYQGDIRRVPIVPTPLPHLIVNVKVRGFVTHTKA